MKLNKTWNIIALMNVSLIILFVIWILYKALIKYLKKTKTTNDTNDVKPNDVKTENSGGIKSAVKYIHNGFDTIYDEIHKYLRMQIGRELCIFNKNQKFKKSYTLDEFNQVFGYNIVVNKQESNTFWDTFEKTLDDMGGLAYTFRLETSKNYNYDIELYITHIISDANNLIIRPYKITYMNGKKFFMSIIYDADEIVCGCNFFFLN